MMLERQACQRGAWAGSRRPPDELAAWRRERRRRRRRADRVLRALFAVLFLVGAAGGYLVAAGAPPWRW